LELYVTAQALPYVILLGFLFGTSLIASRFSVGQFEPITYTGLRLALAGLGYVAVYALASQRHWPTDRRLWRHAAVLGVFGTAIPMTAIVLALQYQSGGLTALLITTSPAITVLLAHRFLDDEALTRRKAIGVTLALGGAVVLALRGESGLPDVSQANPIGYGLVLLAIVPSSIMTIYARKFMKDMDAFDVGSVRTLSAAIAVIPLSILLAGVDLHSVDFQGYLALAYAALIGTFSGFLLAFHNIKRFGATAAATTSYVIPVVTGIGGVLVLGETVTLAMLMGMGVIIAGIAFINQGTDERAGDIEGLVDAPRATPRTPPHGP
jgi:drug/metabolite transporter (DMT)-like permease